MLMIAPGADNVLLCSIAESRAVFTNTAGHYSAVFELLGLHGVTHDTSWRTAGSITRWTIPQSPAVVRLEVDR